MNILKQIEITIIFITFFIGAFHVSFMGKFNNEVWFFEYQRLLNIAIKVLLGLALINGALIVFL